MGENTREGWQKGYGLEKPGQYFTNPQTYDEMAGPDWRESTGPPANPGVLLGTEQGQVQVPNAVFNREPTPRTDDRWIFGQPEYELAQFRGLGPAPALPEDPKFWQNEDWNIYFSWVATDPQQFQRLQNIYDRLDRHYRRQG